MTQDKPVLTLMLFSLLSVVAMLIGLFTVGQISTIYAFKRWIILFYHVAVYIFSFFGRTW